MEYLTDVGRVLYNKSFKPRVAIFAGAGLSEESGLTTFRDTGGLWTKYDINEICNITSYKKNKDKVLEFYNIVKAAIQSAEPNAAHYAIAKLQQSFPKDIVITTSNVDNLLEKAGCTNVLHVHGDCEHLSCTNCYHRFYIGDSKFDIPDSMKCPSCGRIKTLKPGVVFFGEQAPSYEHLLNEFSQMTLQHRVLIGSSLKVNPPQFFSLDLPGQSYYLDRNPDPNVLVDFSIAGDSTVIVPATIEQITHSLRTIPPSNRADEF